MAITALIKRKVFNVFGKRFDGYWVFMSVHRLWIPVYALLWIHGPLFFSYSIFPLAFLLVEKFIQKGRSLMNVQVVEAKMVGKDVLGLKMRLTGKKKFRFKAGQYIYLSCPHIDEREWHPFTLTSAPEEEYFSCHIRCRADMDWTFKLRDEFGFSDKFDTNGTKIPARRTPVTEETDTDIPLLRVDGPYGSASEEVFEYETCVLVGAGIGVTPFISVLKSISMRMHSRENSENFTVYFYWICRDQVEFDSFKDILKEAVADERLKNKVEVNTYATGEINLKQVSHEIYNQFSGKP